MRPRLETYLLKQDRNCRKVAEELGTKGVAPVPASLSWRVLTGTGSYRFLKKVFFGHTFPGSSVEALILEALKLRKVLKQE